MKCHCFVQSTTLLFICYGWKMYDHIFLSAHLMITSDLMVCEKFNNFYTPGEMDPLLGYYINELIDCSHTTMNYFLEWLSMKIKSYCMLHCSCTMLFHSNDLIFHSPDWSRNKQCRSTAAESREHANQSTFYG
jgi:hypothetical protein